MLNSLLTTLLVLLTKLLLKLPFGNADLLHSLLLYGGRGGRPSLDISTPSIRKYPLFSHHAGLNNAARSNRNPLEIGGLPEVVALWMH